jgi:uncharacterized protein (TIGR03435 family)
VRPEFEVASVKRNVSCGGRRGGLPSPGIFRMECVTLQTLIEDAYCTFADGATMNPKSIEITGRPGWFLSDFYDISARAEGAAPFAQMAGPMVQKLLEDRFKLKVHRQVREVPVYFLSVAKGGLKLERTKEGSCVIVDLQHPRSRATAGEPRPLVCGGQGMKMNGAMVTMTARGITMEMLANDAALAMVVGRPILDKTGLTGQFDMDLEFAPEGSTSQSALDALAPATPSVAPGPSIFGALQKLGLKLEPGKGSIETLVIDHVERPSEN